MKMKDLFAVIILLGGFWLFSDLARAEPLDPMQAATIYTLAHSTTHLPLPEVPPTIHMTSADAINKMLTETGVCPKGCPSVKAAQIEDSIYVDDKLDFADIQNAAILLHEMVHFLQYAKDGPAKTYSEWRDREIYAYQAQNFVLNKAGARMVQAPAMPKMQGPLEKQTERGHFYTFAHNKYRHVTAIPFKHSSNSGSQSGNPIKISGTGAGDTFPVLGSPMEVASSEHIVPPMDQRSVECREKYFDHTFIAQARQAGKSQEWLETRAMSSPNLSEEHRVAIMALIAEAFKAEDIVAWLNSFWIPCVNGNDSAS